MDQENDLNESKERADKRMVEIEATIGGMQRKYSMSSEDLDTFIGLIRRWDGEQEKIDEIDGLIGWL